MLQVIKYKQTETSIKVGFKKHNFVVYGEIGIFEGLTKEQHLQLLYEQCKNSIDYEAVRYLEGKGNSITTDLDGEKFIPELPKLQTLKLEVEKDYVQFEEGQENEVIYLSTTTKDQYGDDIDIDVELTATLGDIEENILTIPSISEFIEIVITASVGEKSDIKIIYVYPYIETQPDKIDLLDGRVTNVEQALQIALGGE